jgi:hypothetical protein
MRESCTYGSVRGARGNSRPYRDAGYVGLWHLMILAAAHKIPPLSEHNGHATGPARAQIRGLWPKFAVMHNSTCPHEPDAAQADMC